MYRILNEPTPLQDGTSILRFDGIARTTSEDYLYPIPQDVVVFRNMVDAQMTVTVGNTSTVVAGGNYAVFFDVTKFSVITPETRSHQFFTVDSRVNQTKFEKVEFRGSDPTDLADNPTRIWVRTDSRGLKYTVDGVNINAAADQSALNATNAQVSANTSAIASNTTAISNIGNASPKGAFATLAALQAAFPTGTTGVYVVTADGHWYYWNGTAWTDGGVYQASSIGNKSITEYMLSDTAGNGLVSTPNLFNKATVTSGGYIGAGGSVVTSAGYFYSDFIKIDKTQPVAFSGAFSISFQLACYDASKVFLGTIFATDCTGSLGSYIVDPSKFSGARANTVYIRGNMTQPDVYMMAQSATMPSYAAYNLTVKSIDLTNGIKNSIGLTSVLNAVMTDDNKNTALGVNTLTNKANTMYAVAVGYEALKLNTTDGSADAGLYNVGVGYGAMRSNTIGNHNTAVGFQAAAANTTGTGQTAVGEDALLSETTGNGNTAIGMRAIQNSAGAVNNTAVGLSSMYFNPSSNVTGSENTAIGHYSGSRITSDVDCTFVGHFANKDAEANSYTNSTAVGANAIVNKSNQVVLGSSSVTETNTYGDFQCMRNGGGMILKSANGTRYKVTISDAGQFSINLAP